MAIAVIIGASGGMGAAALAAVRRDPNYDEVIGFARNSPKHIDLTDEASIERAAQFVADRGPTRLIIDATGILSDDLMIPEKSLRSIDPAQMARSYAVNAVGPALLMKHFLPLLPRDGRAVFATLSAKVGSIGDNKLGGWFSYRASKAALNQIVRTAAIELARSHPQAICVAVHPGTVDTRLSKPFSTKGLDLLTPETATDDLLAGLETLSPMDSGKLVDRHGQPLPW